MRRTVFLMMCLLIVGVTVVAAQSSATDEVTAAPTEYKDTLTVPGMQSDSARMRQVYGMMSKEELSVFAKRIYLVKKFQAKKQQQTPPEELSDELLSDRNKLIEYIIENSKE